MAVHAKRTFSIRHVLNGVLPGRNRSEVAVAVMNGYVDASGSEGGNDSKCLSAAGGIATEAAWIAFERAWAAELAKEGINQFSTEDYAHSTGEFKTWKGDSERQVRLMKQLIEASRGRDIALRACSIDMNDWHALNLTYKAKESFGGPYAMCASLAMFRLRKAPLVQKIKPKVIQLFVEHGDCNQHELVNLCSRDINKLNPIVMRKKIQDESGGFRYVRPFEIADLCAYESRLYVQRPGFPTRISAWRLQQELGLEAAHMNLDSAMRECVNLGVPLRESGAFAY